MNLIAYKIKKIPDLTLSKYQALGENGVEGVLERHIAFLRQWQGLSNIGNIIIDLIYLYDSKDNMGSKISVYLIFRFSDEKYTEKIISLMKASPLTEFFDFKKVDYYEIEKIHNLSFTCATVAKKIERKKMTDDDKSLSLYTVESFETNEKSRLYDLIKIMESLNEDAAYIISLKGINAYEKISSALDKPISYLRKRTYGESEIINLQNNRNKSIRDVAVENTLKEYEDFLSMTIKSPCFLANIRVLSNNKLTSKIILNSAVGEGIEKGNVELLDLPLLKYPIVSNRIEIEEYCNILPNSLNFWTTLFSLEEISPFFRLPALYDGKYCEIQKETAPDLSMNSGIYLGNTVQDYKSIIPLSLFMKHMFVCGVPGSGKTNTMLHIANSLWKNKERKFNELISRSIPFLVLEPAKKEYRELALYDIPELIIFSPSANTQFPLQLNPFEFPKGLTLSEHITTLKQVFEGAFPIEPPAPFILDQAIEKIYIKKGWSTKDINDGSKQYPIMSELYDEFKNILENTTYDSEIRGNIQSVLEMRIGSLIRREKKDIFDVEKSILSPEEWINKPVIMELESLGKETANFITLLICSIIRETLKVNPMSDIESRTVKENGIEKRENWKPLRHVIFIEEAHNLIANQNQMESSSDSNPKIAATECIVDMLKEVRALREGIIIADQLPTALATDVIKNSNIKLVHRLTSSDDRGLIGGSMSATELQLEQMSTYLPGQALISYEGLMKPYEIRVCNLENHGNETPNDIQLYEIMKNKIGQKEIYERYEMRSWATLQKKILTGLELEMNHRKALRKYDFTSKDSYQIKDYFEQCLKTYQAFELMKQSFQFEFSALKKDFIDLELIKKTEKILRTLGNKYREDVLILINNYM